MKNFSIRIISPRPLTLREVAKRFKEMAKLSSSGVVRMSYLYKMKGDSKNEKRRIIN